MVKIDVTPSTLVRAAFDAQTVGARVDYRVLLPSDHRGGEPLPFLLHLHAAMSASDALERSRPLYDAAIAAGHLPRTIIACPSTPTEGGFYLDRWEALAADEFPAYIADRFGPPTATAVIGASMGGYGALKFAFTHPDRFVAAAAISPAIFPGEAPDMVPERNVPSVLGELHRAMGTDASAYATQSVYGRARANADAIRSAAPRLWIDCGAADEFLLHEGAEYLHRVLDELEIVHEHRLVPNARHVDAHAQPRTADAIRFIGTALAATASR
jgi:S-formylglutathione hydrolase